MRDATQSIQGVYSFHQHMGLLEQGAKVGLALVDMALVQEVMAQGLEVMEPVQVDMVLGLVDMELDLDAMVA